MVTLVDMFAISLLGCFIGAFLGHLIADFLCGGMRKKTMQKIEVAKEASSADVKEDEDDDNVCYLLYKKDGR